MTSQYPTDPSPTSSSADQPSPGDQSAGAQSAGAQPPGAQPPGDQPPGDQSAGSQSGDQSAEPPASPPGTPPAGAKTANGGEPDYRFTLANERTFLAYLRTALAIDAGGIAIVEFVTTLGVEPLRRVLGIVLSITGVALTVGGFLRWRANLRAMRRHHPLPRTMMPLGLACGVLVMSLIALYLVAFG